MNNQVSLSQAFNAIKHLGATNTIVLRAQPGIGKSWLLKDLSAALPDYLPCYIDCANLDLGDLAMPVIDRDTLVTNFAVNARFNLHKGQDRPLLIMLDEITKPSSEAVLNMLLPLLLEKRIGDRYAPAGSIIFGTGNLDTDNVGDMFPGHAYNRVTVLDVRNPYADEWIEWAVQNDIAPEICAFAKEYPQIFDRYDNPSAADNPDIYNPVRGNVRAVCTPRSLHHASHIVKQRDVLGDSVLALLAGTVGAPAAAKIEAFVTLMDAMPRYATVLASPDAAALPSSPSAYFMSALAMVSRVKEAELDAVVTYVNRWESFEAKALFCRTLSANDKKIGWAVKNRQFTVLNGSIGKLI